MGIWTKQARPHAQPTYTKRLQHLANQEQTNHTNTPVTAGHIAHFTKRAPAKAAAGYDAWRPHGWSTVPVDGHRQLAGLLQHIGATLTWPKQTLANIAAFIRKPAVKPSERPITLTCGLYRLYCQVRKDVVDRWDTKKAGVWDKAVAGSSAPQAGLARAFNHEIHHHLGLTTGSIVYAMEKFYDTLDPVKVVDKTIGLGHEATSLFLSMTIHTCSRYCKANDAMPSELHPTPTFQS